MARTQHCDLAAERLHLNLVAEECPLTESPLEKLRADHSRHYGWSLVCCGWQRELAEDVLQEAYLRVLDGRAVFSGHSSIRTWFCAVIKRVASESRRTQERRSILNLKVVAAEEGDGTPGADSEAEAGVLQRETCEILQAALLMLSARQREVIHLVFYSELTLEQTAETLQISVGSARTHYHRGKQQLAELLKLSEKDD